MTFFCTFNSLASPLLLASTYQANVTQFIQTHIGPEVNILETVQQPHAFLEQIAQAHETPLQAMFRFHEKTVADLSYGEIPAPIKRAAMQGHYANSTDQRIEQFFDAVLSVMAEGVAELFVIRDRDGEITQRFTQGDLNPSPLVTLLDNFISDDQGVTLESSGPAPRKTTQAEGAVEAIASLAMQDILLFCTEQREHIKLYKGRSALHDVNAAQHITAKYDQLIEQRFAAWNNLIQAYPQYEDAMSRIYQALLRFRELSNSDQAEILSAIERICLPKITGQPERFLLMALLFEDERAVELTDTIFDEMKNRVKELGERLQQNLDCDTVIDEIVHSFLHAHDQS